MTVQEATILNRLARSIREENATKGFHRPVLDSDDVLMTVRRLMLVVTECSEAVEELRKGRKPNEVYYSDYTFVDNNGMTQTLNKPEGFGIEVADAIIRLFDVAGATGLNIGDLVLQKIQFNRLRPYMHGGKLF
jgi:hypothetical protein